MSELKKAPLTKKKKREPDYLRSAFPLLINTNRYYL